MARIGLLDCVDGSSWLRKADRDPTWSVSLTSFDPLSGAHRSTPGDSSVREQVLPFQNYRCALFRFFRLPVSVFELRRQTFARPGLLLADKPFFWRSSRSKYRPSSLAAWRQ